jgi:hypothetical protein
MLKTAVLLAAVAIPGIAHSQAFGVQMGAPVSRYGGKLLEGSKFSFEIRVPEPNSEFESYVAIATPQTGICKVTGLGVTHQNDDYGTDTRAAYDRLRDALTKRYGTNKSFDFIKYGALWNEPREWVWSIYKKERTLSAYWDKDERSSLPQSVSIIGLHAKAVSSSAPYITLNYEFANMDTCSSLMGVQNEKGL